MKKFERDGKINFVDENNIVIGFDNEAQCCENFGYFYSRSIPLSVHPDCLDKDEEHSININEQSYRFNPNFCIIKDMPDKGGIVTFKLINIYNKKDIVYLTLYNHQNGYYSHGFHMDVGGKTIRIGSL